MEAILKAVKKLLIALQSKTQLKNYFLVILLQHCISIMEIITLKVKEAVKLYFTL